MSDLAATRRRPSQRTKTGQFLPGTVPNPDGRPALPREFHWRCRDFMTQAGWARLVRLALEGSDRDASRALELIAAYAYGRPRPGTVQTGEEHGPLANAAMTPEERRQRIDELLAIRAMDF